MLEFDITKNHINEIFNNNKDKNFTKDENLNTSSDYKFNDEKSTCNKNHLATNINMKSENFVFKNNNSTFKTNKLQCFDKIDANINNLTLQQSKLPLIESINQSSKSLHKYNEVHEKEMICPTENKDEICKSDFTEIKDVTLHDSDIPILQALDSHTNSANHKNSYVSKLHNKSQINNLSKSSSYCKNLPNVITSKTTLNDINHLSNNIFDASNSSIATFSSKKGSNDILNRPPIVSQKSTGWISSFSSQFINRNNFDRFSEGNYNNYSLINRSEYRNPTESLQKRINAYCAAANIPKSVSSFNSTIPTYYESQSQKK